MHHPIEDLFAKMASVAPFPRGVVAVPARLPRTAFFPGGAGLWGVQEGQPLPDMPRAGVMVVGHDFHSEQGFAASLAEGAEVKAAPSDPACRHSPTWTTLLSFLGEAGIQPGECFFTNAYMGLRAGAGTTGRFPGSKDLPFVARCQTFFRHQLRAQQPRIVLALGAWVPAFLAPLAGRLQPWTGIRSLAGIDAAGPVQDEVSFGDDIASCSVVALTHPSLRGPNVGRRKYGGEHGHAAELKMVQEAMSASGVTERIA